MPNIGGLVGLLMLYGSCWSKRTEATPWQRFVGGLRAAGVLTGGILCLGLLLVALVAEAPTILWVGRYVVIGAALAVGFFLVATVVRRWGLTER
jgi:hypothetical protein